MENAAGAGIVTLLIVGAALLVFVTSIWVFIDATNIGVKAEQIPGVAGMGPGGWLFACLGIWIVAFPYYLSVRDEYKRINEQSRPLQPPPPTHPTQPQDFDDQLRKLARLKQEGLISEDEFNQKKKSLLGI